MAIFKEESLKVKEFVYSAKTLSRTSVSSKKSASTYGPPQKAA